MYNPFHEIVALMPEVERPLTVADITTISGLLQKAGMTVSRYGDVVETLKYLANNNALFLKEEGELIYIKKEVHG